MKSYEADEFVKLFEAMDRRFRGQYNFPVYIVGESGHWILSRTAPLLTKAAQDIAYVYLATSKRLTKKGPIKGLRATTDLRSFRLFKGRIDYFTGQNMNMSDIGSERAEIRIIRAASNWIGSTSSLFKALGNIDEVRVNLADPEIMQHAKR